MKHRFQDKNFRILTGNAIFGIHSMNNKSFILNSQHLTLHSENATSIVAPESKKFVIKRAGATRLGFVSGTPGRSQGIFVFRNVFFKVFNNTDIQGAG
jgi:hypothetical protein